MSFRKFLCLSALLLLPAGYLPAQETASYSISGKGTRILEGAGGLTIKMLVEGTNLGGDEVEVGEITFPGLSPGGGHVHETNEIFYVLSGKMEHIVNGESAILEPGMVGIVRKGDTVSHKILSEEPCKALVIWAPGGEADRLAQFFEVKPID
jgi:quercetin dioxygenase-like cupin family protein